MKRFLLTLFIWNTACFYCIAQKKDTTSELSNWAFTASVNNYLLPDAEVFVNPVFSADRKKMHLQARYNYEDMQTGSIFGGYNFSIGNKVEFSATPILGTVFGKSNGIAPGLIWNLSWWKLNLYTESEYLFEFTDKEADFYYAWAELTISPKEWIWLGISVQRTKLFQTDLEVQRGITLGFSQKFLSVSTYIFNLGFDEPFGVVSVDIDF